MLLKTFYKAISEMLRWKKYEDEILIPVWELIAAIIIAITILYRMIFDS